MFFINAILLLHLFNTINKHAEQTGYVGFYPTICFDYRAKRVFRNKSEDYTDSMIYFLRDTGYITLTNKQPYLKDNEISDITLTYKGQHYILFFIRSFCKSLILPIVVAFITAALTTALLQ